MFKRLKQKIESESEGEQSPVSKNERARRSVEGASSVKESEDSTPERSATHKTPDDVENTPSTQHVIARVHQLLEAGRAQNDSASVQNSEQSELTESSSSETPNKKDAVIPQSPGKLDYKSDDSESGKKYDVATKEELLTLAKKQEKALTRYKTKFSEVVDAYKNLQKENEKLQLNLGQSQDKQIRKISELKETIELEKKAKMHIEDSLRITMEEKDDLINVLKIQVDFLKKKGAGSDLEESNEAGDELDNKTGSTSNEEKQLFVDKIKELEVTVETQVKEIAELKERESCFDVTRQEFVRNIEYLQQEKQTAIQEMMSNVGSIVEEKNKCDLEIKSLTNELQATKVMLKDMKLEKEEIVQKMDKTLEDCEVNEKNKLTKLKDVHKASAESMLKDHSGVVEELKKSKSQALELVKQQHRKKIANLLAAKEEEHKQVLEQREKQLENILSQKEEEIKAAYFEKVKEVELAVEEQELQKHAVVKRKFEEMSKLDSRIQELEEQLQGRETLSQDLKKSKEELIEWQKKYEEVAEKIQKDEHDFKKAIEELLTRIKKHEEENNNFLSKTKALQDKLNDMTRVMKKSEQAAVEREKEWKFDKEKHKNRLEKAIKEIEEKNQGELAIASKKSDSKISEMKKIVKLLRRKLTENENQANEVQEKMKNAIATKEKEREELVKQTNAHAAEMKSAIESLKTKLGEKEVDINQLNLKCATLQQKTEEGKQLKAKHDKSLSDNDTTFNDLRGKLEDKTRSCAELEEKITGLISGHELRMSELTSAHQIQVDELKENYQKESNEQKKSLEEEKNSQQIRMSKEAELKVQEMKKIVNELRNNLRESESREEELRGNLDAESNLREGLEKETNDKQEALRQLNLHLQDYESKINELKSKINTLNQDRETAFKEKEGEKVLWMNELESRFNEKLKEKDGFLNNAIEQLTKENELNVDDIARNYEAMKDEQVRSLQERFQAQIAELNNVHERTMAFTRKETDESCERLVSEAKEREEQLSRQYENLCVMFENHKTEYERKEEDLLDKLTALTKEIQLKDEKLNELQDSKVVQEKEINQLKLNMDDKVMELIEKHRQEMDEVKRESEQNIQEVSYQQSHVLDKQENEMNQMKAELEGKLRHLENEHITQLHETKESYRAKSRDSLQRLHNENSQLTEILEKQQREAENESAKQAQAYENLRKKCGETAGEYKESCLEKTKLKDLLESVKSERDQATLLCDEMNETLKIQETKHIELVDLLNQELEGLKNCRYDLEKQVTTNNETMKKLQNDLRETTESHKNEKERLVEESNAKSANMKNELSTRNQELDDHLKRIQSESQEEISDLKENVTQLEVKIKEMLAEQETEVESYKKSTVTLRKKMKALTEEGKKKELRLSETTDQYEKVILEMKQREENLKLEIATSRHDSRTIDEQIKKLLTEKQELQTLLGTTEETYRHEMREVNEKLREVIARNESEVLKKQEEMTEKMSELEKEKREALKNLNETLAVENKKKMLEMKKKAESKISSLRKQLTNQLEEQRKEISLTKENMKKLENELGQQQISHSENVQRMAVEHETIVRTKIEEVESQRGATEDNEKIMLEKVAQLEASEKSLMEIAENLRVEKMEALREQSLSLAEDHRTEVGSLHSEHTKNLDLLEKRLQAKLEEKDYEYNSKIKQVVKEFQAKLAGKNQEIQDTLAQAIENSQKEERQLAVKFEEEIVELRKELKYREDEMVQLKTDNEGRFIEKEKNLSDLVQAHEKTLEVSELDYQTKFKNLNAKHEDELKNSDQSEHLIAIEQKYEAELEKAQKVHSSELVALEKKLKNQMKKNQTEMKKLLNAKDAEYERRKSPVLQTNDNGENQNDRIDVLKATIERLNREMDLLREREQLLQSDMEHHVDNGPQTPQKPELNLTSNPFSTDSLASPSYTSETEYEYLRNILFQYMMGKQRKQLSKVLATIVRFTPSQFQQIVQKEQESDNSQTGFFSPLRS